MSNPTIYYNIGARVKKEDYCYYSHSGDNSGIPFGAIGTVVKIRSRYMNTPNAYHLYIVQFDGYDNINENELNNQYSEHSLSYC
jgi:hypothetical protein